VAGEHLPTLSPRDWEVAVRRRLERAGLGSTGFRLIRSEGRYAVVEIEHRQLPAVRSAWASSLSPEEGAPMVTVRTWGTLVGAKAWLRWRARELSPGGPRTPSRRA